VEVFLTSWNRACVGGMAGNGLMAMPVVAWWFFQQHCNARAASRLSQGHGAGEGFAQRQRPKQHAHETSPGKRTHSLCELRPGGVEASRSKPESKRPDPTVARWPATPQSQRSGRQGMARCESQTEHGAEVPDRFSRVD